MTKKLIALFIALIMLATPFTFFVNADGRNPFAIGVGDTPGGGNDYFASAQVIHSDFTVTGTLATDTEIDYYKLTIPIDGLVNFWLGNIPAGCDYDLMVFDEAEEVKWTSLTDNDYEEILGQEVSAGEIYYILVCAYSGYSTTQPYTLRAKVYPESYTYYGQTAPSTTTDYVTNFTRIYDADYRTAQNWQQNSWYINLSDYGCYSCSFAMILRNLNKSTVRTIPNVMAANGSTIPQQYMLAQPYTILWANTTSEESDYSLNSLGTTFSYDGTNYITAPDAEDMCYTQRPAIATLFDVTIHNYNVSNFYSKFGYSQSEATKHKKNAIANLLSENPEGIIAVFYNSQLTSPEHAIVITGTTFEGWEYDYSGKWTLVDTEPYSGQLNYTRSTPLGYSGKGKISHIQQDINTRTASFSDGDLFTVCDPGRNALLEYGNQVSLNNTYTSERFDWTHLIALITID